MSRRSPLRNLGLVGFMGTGKSTVGRLVAAQLGFDFLDTDHLIEARAGVSISTFFSQQGEPAFRALERAVVAELNHYDRTVISTGGGLVVDPNNLADLKSHAFVVCLWASPRVIFERVSHQTHRPLLQGPDPEKKICELLAAREPFYKQADAMVNTEMRSAREVATLVIHHFHLASGSAGP